MAVSAQAAPRVLVSVLVYNHADDAIETLRALQAQTYPHMDLLVIDNASTTDCVAQIHAACPNVEMARLADNGGYAGGNNAALERGLRDGYDYVIVSNDDVAVDEGLVARLVATASADVQRGVVGVVEEDYHSGQIRVIGGRDFCFWRARGRWITAMPAHHAGTLRVPYVQGALLLVSRRALELGVRFDERLFMYCDEMDLGFQLDRVGLQAVVDLDCRVRHKGVPRRFARHQGYFIQRNRLYICRKHGSALARCVATLFVLGVELPVKGLLRTLQGQRRYAAACWRGALDGLCGRMGPAHHMELS